MTVYRLRRFLLPAELEEAFAAELWSHGTLGLELATAQDGRVRLDAYFPDPVPAPALDLEPWRRRGVESVLDEALAERDWLAEYRAAARPMLLGERFLVDPRDPVPGEPPTPEAAAEPPTAGSSGRMRLAIPARNAFGTGSHESTRLAAAWLEELAPAGLDVLDVGTGSGILAFVALRLGARSAVAFDLDPAAVVSARANARLNGLAEGLPTCVAPRPEVLPTCVAPRLFAGRLAALRPGARFDLALVNILPERIFGELPRLTALLRPGARVVSSGNLWSRRLELAERLAASGFRILGERREGEWVAFLLAAGEGA